MFLKLKRYIKNPYYAFGDDIIKTHPEWMTDRYFIKVFWRQMMSFPLDLRHPITFNEKLQWMKLYDRNPVYTELVDKLKVKKWVSERIGPEYVIPTLAVYNSVEDIDLAVLPDRFVLKCNHDSGGVIICTDKDSFDLNRAKEVLKQRLEHDFYRDYREWPYKNVERKVFAEAFIEDPFTQKNDHSFPGLTDYKFFCFDGTPRIMYIANDRGESPTTDFFDMDYHHLPIQMKDPPSTVPPTRPRNFERMKELASVLSHGFRQVRVDFYDTGEHVYFGEMTFFHSAGFSEVHPYEWNVKMGNWIPIEGPSR